MIALCPSLNSNQATPEQKSEALPTDQRILLNTFHIFGNVICKHKRHDFIIMRSFRVLYIMDAQ
jgi:hypothetical protein